jgi:hypothetical protein
VIRPGGELRFFEHVVSRRPGAARVQRFAELFWPHVAGGCHPARDTGGAIEAAGFAITSCDRFAFSSGFPMPKIPHILGAARRPAG